MIINLLQIYKIIWIQYLFIMKYDTMLITNNCDKHIYMITTRFAPSPTGLLHIGGARTALFNWLFSKANNGKFLLRIEDTDKARSIEKAVFEIIKSMQWLGLNHDGEIIFQSAREKRHKETDPSFKHVQFQIENSKRKRYKNSHIFTKFE